ncbi:MAG: hypothetical protein KF705_06320, partial [Phycisphaeraceae bacterium]|nr:hypothetical protein [Phycisphaeraceae bacterium]
MTTPTDTTAKTLKDHVASYLKEESKIKLGGGPKAIERQHEKGRLTARERVARLVDPLEGSPERKLGVATDSTAHDIPNFQELGLWAAHNMYAEHGGAPAAGVVTGIGSVQGKLCMI